MRSFLLTLALLCSNGLLHAEITRVEETRSTSAAEDSKPNSDSVPDEYTIDGQFDRVVIIRMKYKADLLAGLEKAVKAEKIKNGVILSCVGSVCSYHYHAVSNTTFPSKDVFVKNTEGSADIAGMNGYVIDGRLHPHITFANPDHAFGGHLEPGTQVFTFAVVTIGVLKDGIDLRKIDDKNYR